MGEAGRVGEDVFSDLGEGGRSSERWSGGAGNQREIPSFIL
jgi:hypothetical protein